MLVLVKTPHIEIRGEKLPESLLQFLKLTFKRVTIVSEDETAIPFQNSDWYRELKAETTPGENLLRRREHFGWTQKALAEQLGIASTCISDMERGRRPIGKMMAKKLGATLGCAPSSFYW
jgi:DNA-binding XRE family transcriptional regulator